MFSQLKRFLKSDSGRTLRRVLPSVAAQVMRSAAAKQRAPRRAFDGRSGYGSGRGSGGLGNTLLRGLVKEAGKRLSRGRRW